MGKEVSKDVDGALANVPDEVMEEVERIADGVLERIAEERSARIRHGIEMARRERGRAEGRPE